MLKKGDSIPDLTLKNQDDRYLSLSDFKNQLLVIYFYPKDDTPGCRAEACSFRDHYEKFRVAGAEIIGISRDSVSSHNLFASKRKLPFTLLSDPTGKAFKAFQVKQGILGLFGRATFIIDNDGKIIHSFESNLNIQKHIDQSLSIIKKMQDKKK